MSKVKVLCFSISADGYGAGPNQSLENPLGVSGMGLHEWVFPTKSFQEMHGNGGADGTVGVDNDFAVKGFENIGSWILGRNMFTPYRGEWKEDWKGWWGDNPPYHCDVYVLSHYAKPSLAMEGGTTFHFITDGIEVALQKAKESAKGKDVRVGGGVETIRQYLQKQLIDEMHLAVSPNVLGNGENLFSGIDLPSLGYKTKEYKMSDKAMHLIITKDGK